MDLENTDDFVDLDTFVSNSSLNGTAEEYEYDYNDSLKIRINDSFLFSKKGS